MNVWLIADTHFNHDNIATYCQRPPDFTELIIRNWQRLVSPEDLIIHLGDVIIGRKDSASYMLSRLPGKKILILGNHDTGRGSATWWMRNGFDFACQGLIFRNVWLTHVPDVSLPSGCDLNVHGHLHNIWCGFRGDKYLDYEARRKPWHRLFAIEYTNYCPVKFDKFVNRPEKWHAIPRQGEV